MLLDMSQPSLGFSTSSSVFDPTAVSIIDGQNSIFSVTNLMPSFVSDATTTLNNPVANIAPHIPGFYQRSSGVYKIPHMLMSRSEPTNFTSNVPNLTCVLDRSNNFERFPILVTSFKKIFGHFRRSHSTSLFLDWHFVEFIGS